MRAFHQASVADQSPIGKLARATATIVFALAMLTSQVVFASAGTLVPAAETGGSGGDQSVSDMLRGAYSPIDVTLEIAVTEIEVPVSVAEMIRGTLSPIDAAPEIAVTSSQSVAEQLRGDLSLIAIGDV